MNPSDLETRLNAAHRFAIEAGRHTLKYFQTDQFEVEKKGDGSPLTIADQEAESLLRERIELDFPEDGIVGEEFDDKPSSSGFCWILDPIDGTKSFISGVPLYGTMVAVEKIQTQTTPREPVIGSVYFPGLDVGIYAAKGMGAWEFVRDGEPVRASVSKKSEMSESVLTTTSSHSFGDRNASQVFEALANQVYFSRTWGDVYGYYLVATGRVEIMIDPELNVWDAAAVLPILEEAGGKFTDWQGNPVIDGGDGIGSNGLLHDQVTSVTRTADPL